MASETERSEQNTPLRLRKEGTDCAGVVIHDVAIMREPNDSSQNHYEQCFFDVNYRDSPKQVRD